MWVLEISAFSPQSSKCTFEKLSSRVCFLKPWPGHWRWSSEFSSRIFFTMISFWKTVPTAHKSTRVNYPFWIPAAVPGILVVPYVHRYKWTRPEVSRRFWVPRVLRSEDRAVFTRKHEPHSTRVLRIDIHSNADCKPHVVAAATHYFLAKRRPAQEVTKRHRKCETLQSLPNSDTWWTLTDTDKNELRWYRQQVGLICGLSLMTSARSSGHFVADLQQCAAASCFLIMQTT